MIFENPKNAYYHYIQKRMKLSYPSVFLIPFLFFSLFTPRVQGQEVDFSGFLEETMASDESFWVRVHAAEALLANNFKINVRENFGDALDAQGPEKIGVLRMLYREAGRDSLVLDSISRQILQVFTTSSDYRTRLTALETMGKLGLYFQENEEISQIANSGEGGIQTMAQWVVANSGAEQEIVKLSDFLNSPDTLQYRYAAYALSFFDEIPPQVLQNMEDAYDRMDRDHPFRVYLTSALWTQSNSEKDSLYLQDLLQYQNGEVYERYEVFQALSRKGSVGYLSLIQQAFSDSNTDVRVSVAQAYLSNEHFTQSRIGWLDWVILVAYGILLLSIGWFTSYFQKSKEDYYLGGGNVNPVVSGISMYVSFFSAISYLAIVGEVIKNGPLIPIINMAAGPVIFLLGSFFLIPFFMNLKMISAYEILEKPLGIRIRKLGSVIFLTTRILWMALLIFLASKSMVVMMGWSEDVILLISFSLGIITIIYTTMGGLKAVLITDVIQFVILSIGALATIFMVASQFEGVKELIPTSWNPNWQKIEVFNFNPYVRLTIFFAFINTITWWICTTGSDQMAIQRFLSTKDLKSARQTFAVTQIGMICMTMMLMFVGFSIVKFYGTKPNLLPAGMDVQVDADFLFPHFIANQFPMGMSGLIIAALFSASMSSLSSGINSASSVLMTDILDKYVLKFKNEMSGIRMSSAVLGVVVILLSLLIPLIPGNVIEVTAKTNGLFIAPLFNLFFMALFLKNPKPFGVVMGSIYGFFAGFTIAFWDVLTGNPAWSFLWIAISSLLVSVLSSLIFNSIFPRMKNTQSWIIGALLLLPWVVFFILI